MKNQSKLISELIINLISIFLALYFWKFISLPYKNIGIIGEYSANSHHSMNDFYRYLFFILFPTIIFLLTKVFLRRDSYQTFFFNIKDKNLRVTSNSMLKICLIAILFLTIVQFFSVPFEIFLDVYHDGQKISSAFKSSIDGSLWSGSYVTVGIFYETLMSKISWKLLDNTSIGSTKFAIISLILLTKILLCLFAYKISKYSNLNKYNQTIFFLILSFIFLKLNNYHLGSVDLISYREIPILVMILLFPTIEKDNLFSYLSIIFLTFISFPVFLWGIDRGIIYNILLIILLCYLIYSLQLRMLICSIITLIASYLFFINLLGNEFEFFFNNSVNILKEINYIHGIIHPNPLSDDGNATRALKSLIAIIASFLICLNLFFTNDTKYLFLKKFLIVISISSILLYINALGRSDGPHIRTTFGLPIIFLSTYIFFNIIFFLEKRFNFIVDKKFFSISLVIVLIVVSTFAMNIRTNNILNFQDRFNYFISLEDNEYLNENYKKYISELKPIIENEVCIQLFTNSAIMPYLLKKKNCSKFYFVWSVGSEKIQTEMINEITEVNFILSDKIDDFSEFSPNYKLPIVKNYIDKNYYIYMSLDEFDLLKKNE